MSEHHPLSPSTYNARVHCFWWKGLDKQSSEASAGSHNHAELQKGIEDINYEPDTYVARWANEWVHCECEDTATLCAEKRLEGTLDDVKGIFGTTDVFWIDSNDCPHFADLKTFSDGTEDYLPQLKGYCALWLTSEKLNSCSKVYFHILHGGICKVETIEYDPMDAYMETVTLIKKITDATNGVIKDNARHLNHYCQYCANIKECPMANQAVQTVNGNGAIDFSKLSLPQKLVICETVEKLVKTLKDDAKQQAIDNGGVLEDGDIRYEIKERAGKGKVRDLCEVASAVSEPVLDNKKGEPTEMVGLTSDELLALCELPKTAFVNAVKEKNKDITSVPKKNIEAWCSSFFNKGDIQQVLVRVK